MNRYAINSHCPLDVEIEATISVGENAHDLKVVAIGPNGVSINITELFTEQEKQAFLSEIDIHFKETKSHESNFGRGA